MKELINHISDPKEAAEVRTVPKMTTVTPLFPRPGQKVWELDLKTNFIEPAKIEDDVTYDAGMRRVRKKVIMREGCLYEVAINQKNADKRFVKRVTGYALVNNINLTKRED